MIAGIVQQNGMRRWVEIPDADPPPVWYAKDGIAYQHRTTLCPEGHPVYYPTDKMFWEATQSKPKAN